VPLRASTVTELFPACVADLTIILDIPVVLAVAFSRASAAFMAATANSALLRSVVRLMATSVPSTVKMSCSLQHAAP
jgi:hypothetical protein